MDPAYIGLLANFGLLAICGLLVSSITTISGRKHSDARYYQLISGVIFGATTAILILFSTAFTSGTVLDSRAAPAILSGIIGGPWAALITMVFGSAARLHVGGDWAFNGVISVVFYCMSGSAAALLFRQFLNREISIIHIAPIAAVITGLALPIFFIAKPFAVAMQITESLLAPLMLTNIISVTALGFMLLLSARTVADRQQLLIMQSAVRRAANGVTITDASDERRMIFANEATSKIFGYSQEELIGHSTDMFFGPDAGSEALKTFRSKVAEGREVTRTFINYRKDGSSFHNQVTISPIFSSTGEVTHCLGIFADVSKEMRVRKVLQTVSGQIPTALIYLNLDNQVEFINDAGIRLLGLKEEGYHRRPLFEVVAPPVLDVLAPFIFEAENGREARSECKLTISDDIEIDARMTSAPTAADSGDQVGVIITIEDITAFKSMEQALAQSQRLQSIGTLTGGIAHDFNNLNTVVIGNLDLLGLARSEEEKSEYVDEALKAARRGAKLTQSLLSFGRQAMLKPDRIDLRSRLTELASLLGSTIKKTTQVEFINDGPPLEVHVDQTNLESAILNLVVNADHAMGDKPGQIRVAFHERVFDAPLRDGAFAGDFEIEALGRFAAITVSDNGPGVPHASRDKIIEPFYTTKGRHSGTGLGLAMVHGFVRQSGGFMRISDNQPTGTTVSLYLPLGENTVKETGAGGRTTENTHMQLKAG